MSRNSLVVAGFALVLPTAASAQSAATISNLLNAEAIELTIVSDTTWHEIKLKPNGGCLGYVYATDRRGAPSRAFTELGSLRYRVRGDAPDTWRPISPTEIGAMRSCAKRQSR